MKTRFKYVALMAVGLLASLASCSNDDENGDLTGIGATKNMLIKISNDVPGTRTEGPAQGATPVGFGSGHIYFTNGTVILKQYKIVSTATAAADEVLLSSLTGVGHTFQDLPANVDKVHVVGNTTVTSTSKLIADIKAEAIKVENQKVIDSVNLYGEAATTLTTPGTPGNNAEYTATVTLAPTVARIELTDMTGSGHIESYEVNGIFVDKYYAEAQVGGTISSSTELTDNGAKTTDNAAAIIDFKGGSAMYPASLSGAIYDWYDTALKSNAKKVAPATPTHVWGYNLFAAPAGSAVPRLIIRMTNFVTTTGSNVTIPDNQFVTIKGFIDDQTNTSITAIEPGKVYSIPANAFVFDETNITPTPGGREIDVKVNVTLATWKPVSIKPEL